MNNIGLKDFGLPGLLSSVFEPLVTDSQAQRQTRVENSVPLSPEELQASDELRTTFDKNKAIVKEKEAEIRYLEQREKATTEELGQLKKSLATTGNFIDRSSAEAAVARIEKGLQEVREEIAEKRECFKITKAFLEPEEGILQELWDMADRTRRAEATRATETSTIPADTSLPFDLNMMPGGAEDQIAPKIESKGLGDLAAQSRQAEVLKALAASTKPAQALPGLPSQSKQEADDFEFARQLQREEDDLALARKLQAEEDARSRAPEKRASQPATTGGDAEIVTPGVEKSEKKRPHKHDHKHHSKKHRKH